MEKKRVEGLEGEGRFHGAICGIGVRLPEYKRILVLLVEIGNLDLPCGR